MPKKAVKLVNNFRLPLIITIKKKLCTLTLKGVGAQSYIFGNIICLLFDSCS